MGLFIIRLFNNKLRPVKKASGFKSIYLFQFWQFLVWSELTVDLKILIHLWLLINSWCGAIIWLFTSLRVDDEVERIEIIYEDTIPYVMLVDITFAQRLSELGQVFKEAIIEIILESLLILWAS